MLDFPLGAFGGLKIVGAPEMAKTEEDWSEVRSPGRARRRRKAGKRQRIKITVTPNDEALIDYVTNTAYIHPTKLAQLKQALVDEDRLDRAVLNGAVAEPARPVDLEQMTPEQFGVVEHSLWSPQGKLCRFWTFPDEMGGPETLHQIRDHTRRAARAGRSPDFLWQMPPSSAQSGLSLVDFILTPTQVCEGPIAFRLKEMVFEHRTKTVLCFATDACETRFFERLRDIRLNEKAEDARWGSREIDLGRPKPHPTLGAFYPALR